MTPEERAVLSQGLLELHLYVRRNGNTSLQARGTMDALLHLAGLWEERLPLDRTPREIERALALVETQAMHLWSKRWMRENSTKG